MRLLRLLARHGARLGLGLLLTLLAACASVGLFGADALGRLDAMLSDMRMRAEPAQLDKCIVIVDIDEKSLNQIGRFPWSRDIQAQLVRQLTGHYGVAAMGYDISFPEADTSSGYSVLAKLAQSELAGVPGLQAQLQRLRPQMDYDALFADAMRDAPVVLGYSVSDRQKKGALPKPAFTVADLHGREVTAYTASGYEANLAQLQQAARGAGIFTALTDSDGVLRSSTLLQRIGDGYYPSLSLATASVYLKATAIVPSFDTPARQMSQAEREHGGLDQVVLWTPQGPHPIPLGEGLTTTIEFRGTGGPDGGAFRYVSAADVLMGAVPVGVLRGAIVLVGTTAAGLNDIRATPVNAEFPGVEVHANLIKSILDGHFKTRPDYALAIELLQVVVLGLLLSVALAWAAPAPLLFLSSLAMAGTLGLNWWLYRQFDAVLDVALPLLLVGALCVLNLAWGYFFEVRKGRALVSRFGQYVAPELVAQMADNPDRYSMDGESRELSVLFADVRGFTTISESMSPQELREYINLYLTAMSEDIRDSHGGTLDKYIGDAVMAFWGAPVAFADHASRAVASALLMQQSAGRLNQQFQARGWPALHIGIGINSGLMHVGDMGSRIRRAYTVMGDAVNLGARLEGITKTYGVGIAVSEFTRAQAPEFAYRELDRVRVKGKTEPVAIYEPRGLLAETSPQELALLAQWAQALQLLRARDWDGCEAVLSVLPADGLTALYAARLRAYRSDPPGADWDGVTTFETK